MHEIVDTPENVQFFIILYMISTNNPTVNHNTETKKKMIQIHKNFNRRCFENSKKTEAFTWFKATDSCLCH